MKDRVAFFILAFLGAIAFTAYRNDQLGDLLQAKFWNTAEAAPPGMGWGAALGATAASAGIPAAGEKGLPAGARPPVGTVGADQIVAVPGISPGVHHSIAPKVKAMVAAAAADGVTLTGAGWRNSERQAQLRHDNGCPDLTSPSSTCRVPTAPVGKSQHEKGLAIDFENCSNRATRAFVWLSNNAARYGLRNLPSEPWHWSTTGR